MARGTQHRKRRPQTNAGVAAPAPAPKKRDPSHPSWEDQLFFSRLRVHAKPVFLLLAVVFGGTFIFLGVGSGTGGIGDLMQNFFSRSSSAGGSSLSALQKKATENPKQAIVWRNLATKLEQDQKTERAAIALAHYVALKPKDESALQELASLYQSRARDYDDAWSVVAAKQQVVSPSSIFRPEPASALGKAFANKDPITKVLSAELSSQATAASQKLGLFTDRAQATYVKLIELAPANATYQFQLASIAQSLGHFDVAKKAYKTFLKLAPNDSLASIAKQQLKVLAATAAKEQAAS